ncbi:MAG: 30S ribosomal protein S14 [Gammaproteobacteria bacterium]
MAKKSVVNRNIKRERAIAQYRQERDQLRERRSNPKVSAAERSKAFELLQKLPRDSSPVRLRNRCALTGRPRGVFRRFGISRTKLREMAMNGEIPGVTKSSW